MKEFRNMMILTGLIIIFIYGLSWLTICGIIKLITLCFNLKFSWLISTGIWLIICILKSIFKNNTTVNIKK